MRRSLFSVLLVSLARLSLLLCAASGPHAQTFNLQTGREPVASPDGLWRFHTGDNPAWADPKFDDSQWPLLRSDETWGQQGYKNYGGFAWYRFTVAVPEGSRRHARRPRRARLVFIRREEREYLWFALLLLANAIDIGLNVSRLLALIPMPVFDFIDGSVQSAALFAALAFFSVVLRAPRFRTWWLVAAPLFISPPTVFLYVFNISSVVHPCGCLQSLIFGKLPDDGLVNRCGYSKPAAKVRILRFKNPPPFRHDRGLQSHV